MQRYDRPLILLAVALAALAGFVDALAFSAAGFFASFMSGNSTRLGVGLGSGAVGDAAVAAGLILAFVAGVMGSAVVARAYGRRRKSAVLIGVALLLSVAAMSAGYVPARLTLLIVAGAMGAENGVFSRDGEVTIGVTYLTGSLVRMGQRLAAALMGEADRFGWVPYLALWLGFVAGAGAGALGYAELGFTELWIPALAAWALAGIAARIAPAEPA